MQSLRSLAWEFLGFYRYYKKPLLDYYRFYKEPIWIIIFILATIIGVAYTHNNDPNNDSLNIVAALGVSVAIILSWHFFEEVCKKDPWLTVLIIPPLAVFIYVGLASDIWTNEVIKALTGVIATFLGFFGIFAGYIINTYNERLSKLNEKLELPNLDVTEEKNEQIQEAKTGQMNTIRIEKQKMLRWIVGIFWCICLSLLLSFISFNYLDLVKSGTEFLGEISGGHPYRFLFFAVLFLYYGLIGTLYLILQFSGESRKNME